MKKGFTLVELLGVVLIIGILATVSLPQYYKSVEKTKVELVAATIRSLARSLEEYRLANGTYPRDTLKDIDFQLPSCALDEHNSGVLVCPDFWLDLDNWGDIEHPNIKAWTGSYALGSNLSRTQMSYSVDRQIFTECFDNGTKVCKALSFMN